MRKYSLIIGLSCCTLGAAFGRLGEVVASYSAPDFLNALARSKSYLYACCWVPGQQKFMIFRMNPSWGLVINSYPTPTRYGYGGLAYSSGGYLWLGNYSSDIVYRLNERTGSCISYWRAPNEFSGGLAPLCKGDNGVGTTALLAMCKHYQYLYYLALTNGSVIKSYHIQGTIGDPAYDWRNKLVWGGWEAKTVYGVRQNGVLVASFEAPDWRPRAMAYHGQYLYVGCGSAKMIYVIHCPTGIGITPSSMGRVKAIFK